MEEAIRTQKIYTLNYDPLLSLVSDLTAGSIKANIQTGYSVTNQSERENDHEIKLYLFAIKLQS